MVSMRKKPSSPPREHTVGKAVSNDASLLLPLTTKESTASTNPTATPVARIFPTFRTILVLVFAGFEIRSLISNPLTMIDIVENSNNATEPKFESTEQPSEIPDFSLAYNQSFGFFDDIPNTSWRLMQQRVKERINHKVPNNPMYNAHLAPAWYQQNFEPDFGCQHERRVGGMGDGGKWVCYPQRLINLSNERQATTGRKCLIYSVGSEGNFMFEEGIADILGKDACEIHVFDFTDYSYRVPESIRNMVQFHPWGLKKSESYGRMLAEDPSSRVIHGESGDHSYVDTFTVSVLPQQTSDYGGNHDGDHQSTGTHDSRSAGTLTAEKTHYLGSPAVGFIASPDTAARPDWTNKIGEQQAQFHQPFVTTPVPIYRTLQETIELLGHQGQIIDIFKIDCEGCEWTTYHDWLHADVDIRQILVEVHHVPREARDFFLSMQRAGYVTFHKEPNIEFGGGACNEYCFLKLGQDFFSTT